MLPRVLIVEDDGFFREVFCDLLTGEGYDVDVSSTGEDALQRIAANEYHVVVTDLVMQGVTGLDILSKVKQKDPSTEVIMVTGHANMETAIYSLKNGARDYLIKPINHDEFKHAVALCIDQRRLLEENQELKCLVDLFQVSRTIANCLDLERLNSLVLDALAKEAGAESGFVLGCEGLDNLVLKEFRGFSDGTAKALSERITSQVKLGELTGILVRQLEKTPEERELLGEIREAMYLPLRSRNQVQGLVVLYAKEGEIFSGTLNYKSLNFLLDQSSLAYENAVHFNNARNLLYIDELTGLFNYRYLEVALEREIKRAERYGSSLSVLFLDLDEFKSINDEYGHLVGSKILRDVGTLLKKSVREVDSVMRYGGDEYTIILIETGLMVAATVAERIRRSIANHHFLTDDGLDIRITASLGYACFPDDTKSKIELLEFADRAMYRGKTSGKNVAFPISTVLKDPGPA